jgi:hypothetical protein
MTLTEVQDALIENADFEEVASVTKAKAFITAAKRYFILAPNSSSKEGASLSLNIQQVENLMRRAQDYVRANDTANNSSARPRVNFLGVGARE